jgi:hypothetical protein
MVNRSKRWQIGLSVLLIAIYGAVLLRNLNESERRSLELKETPVAGDQIEVALRVVGVNLHNSEITARMSFRLVGSFAKDPVTPAVDLILFVNDIRGAQEIALTHGRRIDPIEVFFPLNGNENKYPFDYYDSEIRMVATRKVHIAPAAQPVTEQLDNSAAPRPVSDGGLVVTARQEDERVPISSSLDASVPGLKFEGKHVHRPGEGIEGFNLMVRRADNVIVVSVLFMVLMMSLAVSVFMMGIQSAGGDKIELVPLSLSIALLFGLPALRNAQPGVPALGAFGDYLSFIWAEQIVAFSAVMLIWTWLTRSDKRR